MTTYATPFKKITGFGNPSPGVIFPLQFTIDFTADQDLQADPANPISGQTAIASGDVLTLFTLPAGCVLVNGFSQVVTAVGTAATCTIGDSDNANGIFTALNLNTAAGTVAVADGAHATYNAYTAAKVVSLTAGGTWPATAAGSVRLTFLIYRT